MSFEKRGGWQFLRVWFFISLSVLLKKVLLFKLYSCVIWVHVINLLSRVDKVAGGANTKEHKNFYVKRQLISKPTLERYKKFIYCVPGLSCHPRAKNPQKTVQHVLGRLYPEANNVIIWHDAINNTLSAHPDNFNQPATVGELLQPLEPFRYRILALVHCHRTGVPDIYKELRRSEFFALSVTRDIVSYSTMLCWTVQVDPSPCRSRG